MENKSTLAENLFYQRKLKGFTQRELSDRSNVTVRTIQRIEKGQTTPHLQTIKMLATALEIDVNELLVLEDPKEEKLQMKWLLLMHATPFIGFILPLFNIFIPYFLWIHKREDNPIYEEHGRMIVNFHINIVLLFIISASLVFGRSGFIGTGQFLLLLAIIPFAAIVMIINTFTAVTKQKAFYPFPIFFITKKKEGKPAKGKSLGSGSNNREL